MIITITGDDGEILSTIHVDDNVGVRTLETAIEQHALADGLRQCQCDACEVWHGENRLVEHGNARLTCPDCIKGYGCVTPADTADDGRMKVDEPVYVDYPADNEKGMGKVTGFDEAAQTAEIEMKHGNYVITVPFNCIYPLHENI